MTAITNDTQYGGAAAASGSDAPRAAVNLSDLSEMENNFITLMVAQIKTQDPTNPVDSAEFLQQYAAMSQVKSMENMSYLAQSNLVLMDNLQTLTAAGLVGKEVKVAVDSLEIGSEALRGQLTLEHPSARTTLRLTDALGAVREIELGPQAAGAAGFELDPAKLGLAPGRYTVEAVTDSGEHPDVELVGLVRSVRVSPSGPVLDVKGTGQVPFYNILEFGQSAQA